MKTIPYDQPKGNKEKRVRRFCLVTYIDKEPLERFLRRSAWIQHFAFITHDRDLLDDGTPKEKHTHVILYTYEAKTSTAIKKNFDRYSQELVLGTTKEAQNTLVQKCNDIISQFRYLRHLDDTEKVQYEHCEVVTDNDIYWNDLCRTNGMNDSSVNTGLQMFDDMLDGVSTREMIMRYGKEYIYHARSFKEVVTDHYSESPRGVDENMLSLLEYKQIASDVLATQNVINQNEIDTFFMVLDYVSTQFNLDLNIDTKGRFTK